MMSDDDNDNDNDSDTESNDATEKPLVPLSSRATGIPNGATPTDSSEEVHETLADTIASLSLANSGDESSSGSPGSSSVDTNTIVPVTELLPDKAESNSNSNSNYCEAEEATTRVEACKKRCIGRQEEMVDLMDSEDVDCAIDMTVGDTEEEAIDLTDD
mmetsp:Transcript_29876/g.70401  ORF Transcript_29876/g.70401 Transcript_29876/m.70401 type:complete len:159 (-) Transcript_29876:91-567(-)